MNPNRWEVVRCAGGVERAHGIKFVLIDKRTSLVVATDAANRKPLREVAEQIEIDEILGRRRRRVG
jgi:hypothetical protein